MEFLKNIILFVLENPLATTIFGIGFFLICSGIFNVTWAMDILLNMRLQKFHLTNRTARILLIAIGAILVIIPILSCIQIQAHKNIIYLIIAINGIALIFAGIFNIKSLMAFMSVWKLWILDLDNKWIKVSSVLFGCILLVVSIIAFTQAW